MTENNRPDSLLDRILERMGWHVRAGAIFGEPVERDGVTVIPVAKARWGFGGGTRRGTGRGAAPERPDTAADEGSRSAGGGGLALSPVGYIEIKDGQARFRPIYDPGAVASMALAGAIGLLIIILSLRRRS